MPFVRIRCPYVDCRKKIRTPIELSEKKARCPACGRPMMLPKLRKTTILSSLVLSPPAAIPVGKPAQPPPVVPVPVCAVPLPGPSPFDWNASAFAPEPDVPTIQEPPLGPIRTAIGRLVLGILAVATVGSLVAYLAHVGIRLAQGNRNANVAVAPEARAGLRGNEEGIVAKHIRDHANDPASVSFDRWGPHWRTTWPLMLGQPGAKDGDTLGVRVIYRNKNDRGALIREDRVLFVRDGAVLLDDRNGLGDGWIDYMEGRKSR